MVSGILDFGKIICTGLIFLLVGCVVFTALFDFVSLLTGEAGHGAYPPFTVTAAAIGSLISMVLVLAVLNIERHLRPKDK